MAQLLFMLALLVSGYSALTIFTPLQWEETWKELIIKDFEAVNHKEAFEGWKRAFGKSYSVEEEPDRFLTWLDNWYTINQHNMQTTSHTLKMNQFSDMSSDKFRKYIHGSTSGSCLQGSDSINNKHSVENTIQNITAIPNEWDWTNVNGTSWITPVKNQGGCGGCWSFSAVGAIESGYVIKNYYRNGQPAPKPIPTLSEQQLVDCSTSYGNKGCQGGEMDDAFKYVKDTGGLCAESAYPYVSKDGSCKASSCGKYYDPITSYVDALQNDTQALQNAVSQQPVSIAIEADQYSFQFYHGGVFHGRCGDQLDHGVLLVGYGHDIKQGMDYWKVKNSWGDTWGESGYIRICRNCNKNGYNGQCGILMGPSYPVAK